MSADVRKPFWRYGLVAAVLGVGVGVAGVTMANDGSVPSKTEAFDEKPVGDESPGTYAGKVSATGPGLSSDLAIAQVLEGVRGTTVTSAELIRPPDSAASDRPWISVGVDSDAGDDVKAVWLGQLVQGAVADLMRSKEPTTADVIGGGQVEDRDSRGHDVTVPLGTGSVAAGQQFDSPSDELLLARAKELSGRFGLTLTSAQVIHPLDSAMLVTLTLPRDQAVSWTIDDLRTALTGAPSGIEGLFIEIDSPEGEPLLLAGTAYRVGGGGVWFAPGQDARFGVVHGGGPASASP